MTTIKVIVARNHSRKAYSGPPRGCRQMNGTRLKPAEPASPTQAKKYPAPAIPTPRRWRERDARRLRSLLVRAMTRRHSRRDCAGENAFARREHRGDFIKDTATLPFGQPAVLREQVLKTERLHAWYGRYIRPPETPPAALGGRQGRAWSCDFSGLRSRPALRSRSRQAARRARRGRWDAPGRSSLRRRRPR